MQVDPSESNNGQAHTDLDAVRQIEELLGLLASQARGMEAQVGASAEDAERARRAAATASEARVMLDEVRKLTDRNVAYASEVATKSDAFRKEHGALEKSLDDKAAALRRFSEEADGRMEKARHAASALQALLRRVDEKDVDLVELKALASSAHAMAAEVGAALDHQRKQAQEALARLDRDSEAALRANAALEARVAAHVRRSTRAVAVGFGVLLLGVLILGLLAWAGAREDAATASRLVAVAEELSAASADARSARTAADNAAAEAARANAAVVSVSQRVRARGSSSLSGARIAVINAVGEDGLADAAADALRRRNLAVVAVGNATSAARPTTHVYTRSGSEPAANELARLTGATSVILVTAGDGGFPSSQPPIPPDVDVVLVIGRQHASRAHWQGLGGQ